MRYRNSGFTLIEVMVSLTIMGIIMTVAFEGLRIGLDGWTRGSRTIDELDRRATVERLLKRQLSVAYPMEFRTDLDKSPFVLFRGNSSRLDFVADYSLSDGPSDFRKISYMFDGGSLHYQETQLFHYTPAEDEPITGEKLASFSSVRFRFLGSGQDGKPAWLSEWIYGMGLPLAVEAQINGDAIIIPMANRQ